VPARDAIGAVVRNGVARFCVWAPAHETVELVLHPGSAAETSRRLTARGDGVFADELGDAKAGDTYGYRLDGEGPFPDPASRFQPQGVHGPSAVVDAAAFEWSDAAWRGIAIEDAILYELHVGTFTAAGTFAGAAARLPDLADLGVTVVELMPVADFPGSRNWGYDGVSLFAPSRAYGVPDDLRRFVDEAHRLGLAVILDVVYNHFGPDGACGFRYAPQYMSARHTSPWGGGVNLDGEGSAHVREFFLQNALHWLGEYHFDGLRLDATHALADESPRHFVAELADRARASIRGRRLLLIAEDERNLASIVQPASRGGWALDAVWADDFHHQVRRLAAGDRDGYYADYTGTMADLALTIREGWMYQGQMSRHLGRPRGTDPSGIPLYRLVVCLQNHDQVGNRPYGDRLHHARPGTPSDPARLALFRALSALLFFVPETPLLFMGQEWAASTPFLFFTDHHPELGALVTKGRREEFAAFEAFADPAARDRIPDPQAASTFEASRLRWEERDRAPHAGVLALYRTLARLRRSEPALRASSACDAIAHDEDTLTVMRRDGPDALLLAVTRDSGRRFDAARLPAPAPRTRWALVFTTNDPAFAGPSPGAAAPGPAGLVFRAA
jgi:maltooligosyltrehalose trehalohydrolase